MAARRHSTPIPTFPLEGGRSHSLAPVSSRTPGVDRGLGCSWEDLPAQRLQRRLARDASDLFAFKANYRGAALAAGPIHPGLHISATDELFRIGNAAGEAHAILGEGMSMALQSAHLLCAHLTGHPLGHPHAHQPAGRAPTGAQQAVLQRRYAAHWRREFVPRMRLAAALAQLAMRPTGAAALMALLRAWPGLLTSGARWGGKVRLADMSGPLDATRARPGALAGAAAAADATATAAPSRAA